MNKRNLLPFVFVCFIADPVFAHRIVSLAPSLTEILFALGLHKEVVGVTRYCDKPKEASLLPKVGGFLDPSLETILALKPTLVIGVISVQNTAIRKILQPQGIQTLFLQLHSIADLEQAILDIGKQTKSKAKASELVRQLQHAFKTPASIKKTKRALVVISLFPLIVAGPNTYPSQALSTLGYVCPLPPSSPHWVTLSLESLASIKPDYLIATGGSKQQKELERWLKNIASKHIHVIATKNPIFERPSLSLPDELKQLSRLLP